jgi:uridine kinase
MHQVSRSLELIWSDLWKEPIFRIGLAVKIVLIIFFVPLIQQEWFVPFINSWIENPSMLPWSGHLSRGGDSMAFPYGPVMFLSHLPTTGFGWCIDYLFDFNYFSNIGFRISLLVADIFLLIFLLQIFENKWESLLKYYWLSPLIIFISYWHGQTDLIPVALFIASLTFLKRGNFVAVGILLALSLSAKHSMILGIPFILLYIWSHNGVNREFQRFLYAFLASFLIIEAPFLLNDAFRSMVLQSPELEKLYWLFIDMGNGNLVYLTPLTYLVLLYFFWRIKRINFDLLISILGVAFSVIIILTPSPPGWYLWLVPILAIHQSRYGFGAIILVTLFSLLFISYHFLHTSGSNLILFNLELSNFFQLNNLMIQSIHYTVMQGFGLLIVIQILRLGVQENDYYRVGSKPISIGIAGDSGAGKSTFSKGIAKIFGNRSLAEISGDDYHNWDRSSPMWKKMTHLNPKANRLFQLVKDVRSLMDGVPVNARSYDHKTGNFLPRRIRKSRNIVLVDGLHALYPKQLLEELDVRFFIEMDESLRIFLRMHRDVKERGHKEADVLDTLVRREHDSEKYIMPQAERADIVFKILPVNYDLLNQEHSINSNLKVRVTIRNGIFYDELVRVLIGVCGLQVNVDSIDQRGEVILEISGDVSPEDINLAVHMLVPHMEELFDFSSEFSSGVQGIMQIIALMEMDEALKRRRVR